MAARQKRRRPTCPWEIQQNDPRALELRKQYAETAGRKAGKQNITKAQALENHRKELAAYNAKVDAGENIKDGDRTMPPPFIARPANLGNQYPAHIFNAMIHPVRPYGIRGAIWYQGERNAKDVPQAFHYREQLALLVGYYRSSWHELSGGNVAKDFPFYFTQLPSWTAPQTEPVEGLTAPWAVNREMMRLVAEEVPNTGIAVAIDTGDAVALHPKNKQPIGLRHAYLALERTYGKIAVGSGPRYKKQAIRGDKIILEFDSIGRGLMAAKPGPLNSFAIAGADRVWHWAEAEIKENTVELSSKTVTRPVAVRYAWAMNPSQRNLLYNREGFPASPFRTDNWPLFDPKAEIVTVDKPEQENEKSGMDWERPIMKP